MSIAVHREPTSASDIEDAVKAFRQQGFVVLRGLFKGDELAALQRETAAQIEAGAERGPELHFRRGISSEGKEVLFRIEAVVAKAMENDSTLQALAHPGLLAMASAILDGEMVCWSDALLWKGPDGGASVAMHSGHGWNDTTTSFENLVVDVYLDEATPENGCLKVLPGSHLLPPEENRALVERGFDIDGLVDVILEPGDVLFHSEWMVHGSAATPYLGQATRRIVYFAFRNPAVFAPSGSSPAQRRKVAACLRRMQLAQQARASARAYGRDEAPFAFTVPTGWADEVAAASDAEAMEVGFFHDILVAGADADADNADETTGAQA